MTSPALEKSSLAMLPIAAVDRKFWAILGASLLLHALILTGLRMPARDAATVLPTLIASLRFAAHSRQSVTPMQTPAPKAEVSPQTKQPLSPREHRSVLATAEAAASPAVAVVASAAATPAPMASVAVTKSAAELPATEAVPAPVPTRPQGNLLEAYRQRLSELLAGQQQYPRVAAMRGWEGEVRLRLRVARKGNLLGVQLDHSSGFEVLDRHALAMLEQLAGLPPLPEGLEANEIQVVVPVNYKLKKTT